MPNYRFGKHPPKVDYRTLRFKNYLSPTIAPPPASDNVLTRVYEKLKITDPAKLFPMDGNDTLGDCTIAALAHAVTVYRGLLGKKTIMAKADVVKLYMHLTGGVDSGLNELDVLNYWRQNKVDKEEILAYVSIDPKNHTHVEQAIGVLRDLVEVILKSSNCVHACSIPFEPVRASFSGTRFHLQPSGGWTGCCVR